MNSVWRQFCPRDIALDVNARNKREALAAVAALCAESHGRPSAQILRALWRRELAESTGLGYGVAIPHARIAGIEEPLTLFVRTKTPISYGAPDNAPVTQLLAVLVPMNRSQEQHLDLLARIAEMLSDNSVRERLAAAPTPVIVHCIVAEWVVHHMSHTGAAVTAGP